ncbi:MAG: hypothetical protein WBC91_07635 [Phototrophicaceae bacterium]
MISIISACTNQVTALPTIQAEQVIMNNANSYYTGIVLESEIEQLNSDDLDLAEIISEIDDIRALPQAIIYDNVALNLIIFECHINYHSGSRIASYMRYRICSIENDSSPNIIAEGIYETSILPNEEWIALVGSQAPFHDCEHQIYIMRPDEIILYPLIDESVYAHQRFCGINDTEWRIDEDNIYDLSFSAWTGSDYPYHQLIFDTENMIASLRLNDGSLFEYNLLQSH